VTAGPKDLTAGARGLPRKPRQCRGRDGGGLDDSVAAAPRPRV